MRLINTRDLTLHEFLPNQVPPYVVLSHRWTSEETTFQAFDASGTSIDKAGIKKIQQFCKQAVENGYEYGWVDTCCIDKRSSAELSEAINSMYKWYQSSACCFAYLEDVPLDTAFDSDAFLTFERSQWFTRGWTLQELLAPADVRFYSSEWKPLGTKLELAEPICDVTGIDVALLKGTRTVDSYSISRRMSWAADRVTTREEDIAYSLLGIFGVNMPMLYGEGLKAFRRLQDEIIKISSDQSLFAWAHVHDDPPETGLLASHPSNFRDSGAFEDKTELAGMDGDPSVSSSKGITLNLFNGPAKDKVKLGDAERATRTAVLKCAEANDTGKFAAIELVEVEDTGLSYLRLKRQHLGRSRLLGSKQNVVVRHMLPLMTRSLQQKFLRFQVTAEFDVKPNGIIAFTDKDGPAPLSATADNELGNELLGDKAKKYVASDPAICRYILPFVPGDRIAFVQIRPQDASELCSLLVMVGITPMGEIGFAATEFHKDYHMRLLANKPYRNLPVQCQRERNWQYNNWQYMVNVSAPDVNQIRNGDECVVRIDINRT